MKPKASAAALALLLALPAFALGEAAKDEVVYALMDASGRPKAVYVVNSFESPETADVTDFGAYGEALPLGRAEGFAYQGGQASFRMPAGRFEYQGNASSLDLPWDISISYLLNGQPAAPAELGGATGLLEGEISITPHAGFEGITNSLTLQTTVTLPGDRALSIQAEKATVAVSGGDRALTFVTLPGQSAEHRFSARVSDFRMPGVQINAIRMAMDTEMYGAAAREALRGTLLENAAGGLLNGFLQGMQGRAPTSFADSRNAVRSVQFVLMGEAIEPTAPEEEPEVEQAPPTFWERVLHLFGG